ncbi:MAG: iron uptake porin [Thermosynechococcaceae cyanobacterium MS004]|nr:iron uptake porin [Thermosynechococcaceae cyanobacterium MS004]
MFIAFKSLRLALSTGFVACAVLLAQRVSAEEALKSQPEVVPEILGQAAAPETHALLPPSLPEESSLSSALSANNAVISEPAIGELAQSEPAPPSLPVELPRLADIGLSDPLVSDVSDNSSDLFEQVTSVSQLSDVQATDWAFQALQSLVERYGCIAGYPDGTFRGNRAATRYELAAALNACLDQISDRFATKEDLETIKALQEEFKAELATLKGRVDGLEARAATLEAQQFSTTTKLSGLVWFNMSGAFAGRSVLAERPLSRNVNVAPPRVGGVPTRVSSSDPNVTFSYYAWLTFNTSFTGKDSLVTQLAVGNGSSPANAFVSSGFFNSWGTPITDQTGTLSANTVTLRELFYSFPATKDLQIVVGARINTYRYFDNNRFTNFLTGAGSFNSSGSTLFSAVDRGAGTVIIWRPTKQIRLAAAYLAESTEFLNPALPNFNTATKNLFGGNNTLVGQLDFSPTKSVNLRFLYARTLLQANGAGLIGGAVGEPLPYGFVDDGVGGGLNNAIANTFVANFDWLVTKGFGLFGRYSYGTTKIAPTTAGRAGGSLDVQSIQAGVAFPDLIKKGALGTISFVVPQDYLGGRRFLRSGNGDGATQYEVEASYYYPISDNIAVVPAFYAIINPNNFGTNPTVFVGNIRTQFRF